MDTAEVQLQGITRICVENLKLQNNSTGDADVDIVKAAVTMAYDKSTTLIGEDTDLLCLLLFHSSNGCMDLYFRSDKDKGKPECL